MSICRKKTKLKERFEKVNTAADKEDTEKKLHNCESHQRSFVVIKGKKDRNESIPVYKGEKGGYIKCQCLPTW